MQVARLLAMTLTAASAYAAQDPEPGISRELARDRAERISDVRYEIRFDLAPGMTEVSGEILVYFSLPEETAPTKDVVLDFGGHDLSEFRVNGVPQEEGVRRVHNHIVVSTLNMDPGRNRIGASFKSKVAPTGTPLTVFRDTARKEDYLYTLVVPADAHRLYPCFDQPDLKGVFELQITVPPEWVAVANSAEKHPPEDTPDGKKLYWFEDTKPISTYVMAFAAGPFRVISARPEQPDHRNLRVFVRGSKLEQLDQGWLISSHIRSLNWLQTYFDYDYPFGKLDVVLVPGFPYGGMEHAGGIFYRESAVVFDHEPTESELTRRSTLVYHEVSHQWFGDLVTMEWFDDLWLKEGFATFIGFLVLEALEPEQKAWLRFHQRVKARAYRIDATSGTTPVYQELGNLADAKSAYGAIVYNKAPALLRELNDRIGAGEFRDGVRLFLSEHAFGNARWSDLMRAFEKASGADLARWSERWILAAGMPRVRVRWEADAEGPVTRFDLLQQSLQGHAGTWPLKLDLLWVEPSGETRTITVETDRAETPIEQAIGLPAPAAVLLNPTDVAYGQFLLDTESQEYWLKHAGGVRDPLRAAVVQSALFDTVREAEMDPARYGETAIELAKNEQDAQTPAWLPGTLATSLHRYLHPRQQRRLTRTAAETLLGQLRDGLPGRELQTFRFLARTSGQPGVLALCNELLSGEAAVPGLTLGTQDRYLALAALLGTDKGEKWRAKMTGDATPAGAEKHAFLAQAAAPDADNKRRYFDIYLQPDDPPEQWMQESLAYFNWRGQDELTLPYLRKALDQVEWVKENRKIFFMPAWIDAFVNGHSSAKALQIVEAFLDEKPRLPVDIRRKIEQSADSLRRAVAIKQRWK